MRFRWTQALAVNNPLIDSQHQELFRRFGQLEVASVRGDRAEAARHLDFVGQYVVEHFGAEETLMEESEYPGLAAHRGAHEQFMREYMELTQGFVAGRTSIDRLVEWTGDWLKLHISGTDQLLANHLAKRV